jgi:hypothetical protein
MVIEFSSPGLRMVGPQTAASDGPHDMAAYSIFSSYLVPRKIRRRIHLIVLAHSIRAIWRQKGLAGIFANLKIFVL